VHKGSTQTTKRSNKGFKFKEQKKPKSALVWRTGLSGASGSYHSKLFTIGFLWLSSAIIHRTVRCATRLSDAPAEQRLPAQRSTATDTCERYSARTLHAEVRTAVKGAPVSEQYLSGAAPDCPVPLEDKAPMVVCA
jgi:hypothetical protein